MVMYKGAFSQMPVLALDGAVFALLTTETIARWLGSKFDVDATHVGLLENAEVREVLEYTENPEHPNFRLVGRDTTVFVALDYFDQWARKGHSLDAILVTNSGRPSESILRILAVFDIPLIHQAFASR